MTVLQCFDFHLTQNRVTTEESATQFPPTMASTTLPDCHWELCHRFMARYQHLFREGQVATLAHFFANTQLAISGHAHQTGQLLLELVRDQAEVKLEVENVENGVGEEAELESVPTIKLEASEDGECAARKEVEVEE